MKNKESLYTLSFSEQCRIMRVMDNMQDLCSQQWERNLLYCTLVESTLWIRRNSAPPEPNPHDRLDHTPKSLQDKSPAAPEENPAEPPSMDHLHFPRQTKKKTITP